MRLLAPLHSPTSDSVHLSIQQGSGIPSRAQGSPAVLSRLSDWGQRRGWEEADLMALQKDTTQPPKP